VGAGLSRELRHHRTDCAGRAMCDYALPRPEAAVFEQSLQRWSVTTIAFMGNLLGRLTVAGPDRTGRLTIWGIFFCLRGKMDERPVQGQELR
jgi:hypothetical protein